MKAGSTPTLYLPLKGEATICASFVVHWVPVLHPGLLVHAPQA